MSEAPANAVLPEGFSAGRLLREARQSQGLHIAALASAIKVTPRKLEALEADRFDELPDATFTRALAQTVCRALKIDAAPVLALLPRVGSGRGLGHLGEGLNTPFREGYGHAAESDESILGRPAVWAPLVLLLIAAAVYFAPAEWLDWGRGRSDAASSPAAVPLATAPTGASVRSTANAVGTIASAPASAVPAALAAEAASAAPGSVGADRAAANERPSDAALTAEATTLAASASTTTAAIAPAEAAPQTPAAAAPAALRLRALRDSWIEVVDAHGQALLSRTLKSGETVGLDGDPPLRLRIGNVAGTEISFRGRPVELGPYNRNNLARFELK